MLFFRVECTLRSLPWQGISFPKLILKGKKQIEELKKKNGGSVNFCYIPGGKETLESVDVKGEDDVADVDAEEGDEKAD